MPRYTRYPVIAVPPFDDGAVQVSSMPDLVVAAVRFRGAVGAVPRAATTSADSAPSPAALIAETRYRYVVPFTTDASVKASTLPTVTNGVGVAVPVPR